MCDGTLARPRAHAETAKKNVDERPCKIRARRGGAMGRHAHASKDEKNREVDVEPAELAVLDAVGQEPRDTRAQAREAAPQDHPATLAEVAALALNRLDGGAEPPDALFPVVWDHETGSVAERSGRFTTHITLEPRKPGTAVG